jgi:hypothetical protein
VSTSVTRNITLALDQFGRASLEDQARALSLPAAGVVRRAAMYFLAERGSGRTALRIPRFAREAVGTEQVELAVALDEADWLALEEEAAKQRVALERLLVHAMLLLIADLDSGRVAVRILDDDD